MRLLSVRLIVSLIFGITLVSLGFSYYQVIQEKQALRSELERRAELLGESLVGNVERSWEAGSDRELHKLVQTHNRQVKSRFNSRADKLYALVRVLGDIMKQRKLMDAWSPGESAPFAKLTKAWTAEAPRFRNEGFYERFPAKGQVERVRRIHLELTRALGLEPPEPESDDD